MRAALNVLGAILIVAGIFWAFQGAGIIMWPAESFMLAQDRWILYGTITAVAGLVLVMIGRRRPR